MQRGPVKATLDALLPWKAIRLEGRSRYLIAGIDVTIRACGQCVWIGAPPKRPATRHTPNEAAELVRRWVGQEEAA